MKKALLTFVKAPVPGTVKTRLQAGIGPEKTVEIYKSFIREILSITAGFKNIDRFLGCAPSSNHDFFTEMAQLYNIETFDQRGSNLGEKIINAFNDYFATGYDSIVLIGSDSPTMPVEYIKMAYQKLEENDFVVGPCCDGGMYLIGAKKKLDPSIFQNIPWDTSEVLNLVLEKLFNRNIQFSMLPFWYDVDNADDLKFLKLHLQYMKKDLPI